MQKLPLSAVFTAEGINTTYYILHESSNEVLYIIYYYNNILYINDIYAKNVDFNTYQNTVNVVCSFFVPLQREKIED